MDHVQAIAYIEEIPRFTKKNKAGNTVELLRRLGHPEERMRIIHVAGTNGKGSVCAFLSQILMESGHRTGLFTSPHLIDINERFQINRANVDDGTFTRAFNLVMEQVRAMMADGWLHPTYFELLFAVGMVIFAGEQAEWLVMETGLGGRLDATNTVEHPVLSVITSISLDHTEYLGDTIPAIAAEKAGIIKPGVPVVYDAADRAAAQVIAQKAALVGAPAFPWYPQMSRVVESAVDGITYVLNNRWFDYLCVKVPFLAEYQVANSSLALMAARILDSAKRTTDRQLVKAVADTRWSGRMEAVLPGVVIDGAHNADGIAQFLRTVRRVSEQKPVSLLFAAVTEKDFPEMIRELAAAVRFTSVIVTRVGKSREVDEQVFVDIFRAHTDVPVRGISDPKAAFKAALQERPENGILFCAGSLYLVSEIKEVIEQEYKDHDQF